MINKVNSSNTSFGSTRILIKNNYNSFGKYLNRLQQFNVVSAGINTSPVTAAKKLESNQVGVILGKKSLTLVGQNAKTDSLIGKIITKIDSEFSRFVNDIK